MSASVLVTRLLPEEGMALLRAAPDVSRLDVNPHDRPMTRDELLAQVRDRDGLVALLTDRVDAELLDAAGPRLRVVANYAVGVDNVDLAAARERGILVTNTPGALTEATADLAFALLLAAARRLVEGDAIVRRDAWPGWGPLYLLGSDVSGATLGVVGAGRIGTAVIRRARAFDMRVLYVARSPKPEAHALGATRVELDRLLGESDFVSVHCSLDATTRHLIDARALALMKRSAFLVNTARGPIVEEAALVRALAAGSIAGAGLDVFEDEPRLAPGLRELPNVVLAPHVGSATRGTRARMAILAAGGCLAVLRGERPENLVDAAAWPGRRASR